MKHLHRAVVVACVGLGVAVAATASPKLAFGRDVTSLVGRVPVSAKMFANCLDCSLCGDNGHKAFAGDETSFYGQGVAGAHGTCFETGGCALQHPISTPGECTTSPGGGDEGGMLAGAAVVAELEAIRYALENGDPARARRIAESGTKWIVYVPERNAVQALGCGDVVVSHISLSPSSASE